MLTYCCVIFGEYLYANVVVPFCNDVDVVPSVVQPNADNLSYVKALKYNMLFSVNEGFINFR